MKLQEMINLLIAYQNGKTVEYCRIEDHVWHTLGPGLPDQFDFSSFKYRLKLRQFWVVIYPSNVKAISDVYPGQIPGSVELLRVMEIPS